MKRIANLGAAVLVLGLGLGISATVVRAETAEKVMEQETDAQLDKVGAKVVNKGAAQTTDAKAAAADAKAKLEAEKAAAEPKDDTEE